MKPMCLIENIFALFNYIYHQLFTEHILRNMGQLLTNPQMKLWTTLGLVKVKVKNPLWCHITWYFKQSIAIITTFLSHKNIFNLALIPHPNNSLPYQPFLWCVPPASQ